MRDDIKTGLLVAFVLSAISLSVTGLWPVALIMLIVGFLIGLMVAYDESDDYSSLPTYKPLPVVNYVEDFTI